MDFQRSILPATLRWASVALCAAIAGMLYWALMPMDNLESKVADPVSPRKITSASPKQSLQELELANVWSRPLQGRRAPAKPKRAVKPKTAAASKPKPVVKETVPQPVSLGVRLVGTIVEPGSNLAIASDQSGTLSFRSEGERFRLQPKGLLVESIDETGIWVRYKGTRIQWEVGEDLRLAKSISRKTPPREEPLNGRQSYRGSSTTLESDDAETPDSLEDNDPDERTPIRPEEFPKMSLEDELDFLNG